MTDIFDIIKAYNLESLIDPDSPKLAKGYGLAGLKDSRKGILKFTLNNINKISDIVSTFDFLTKEEKDKYTFSIIRNMVYYKYREYVDNINYNFSEIIAYIRDNLHDDLAKRVIYKMIIITDDSNYLEDVAIFIDKFKKNTFELSA